MMKLLSALVTTSLLAMACSSPGGGNSGGAGGTGANGFNPPGAAPDYCSAVCGKINQCDGSQDLQTCSASCQNANAAVGPKLRPDYVSRVVSCYQAKDCASVLNDSAVSDCFDAAAAALAPSPAGSAFCDQMDGAATNCGGGVDVAQCLSIVKQYSDATIQGAQSCLKKACSEMDSCLDAQFGVQSSGSGSGNNSCEYAYDGECDEGNYCDYGTDSYDCS